VVLELDLSPQPLPEDAQLAALWPDKLFIESRHCLLPGTRLRFRLNLEGNALPLEAITEACLVVARDRRGYVFHIQVPLEQISRSARQLIQLFIVKGRGSASVESSV